MTKKSDVIQRVCRAISDGKKADAREIIRAKYKFTSFKNKGRNYKEVKKTELFRRDGFIDRYSGDKLVYPPVLKILSNLFKKDFPYQKHWKMSETHIAWWELTPTVDHVKPVAREGDNDEKNLVCTSQLRNSAKSNWTIDELGWELQPEGDNKNWDGMMTWFMDYISKNEYVLEDDPYIAKWHEAALKHKDELKKLGFL
tara:strand:- start:37 stop:633 length:597 start_codon:yes stop_codon:yes gene_type:complete